MVFDPNNPLHWSSMRMALAALKNARAHMKAWQGELGDSIHNAVMRENAAAIRSLEFHVGEIDANTSGAASVEAQSGAYKE